MSSDKDRTGPPDPGPGNEGVRAVTEPSAGEAASFVAAVARGREAEGAGLYALLVECVQDYAIFALDPGGYVLTWNTGAQRIKGYTPAEIIGRHFSTFYPPEDVARGKTRMELEVAARDGRFEDEGWRVRKDGGRFWANVIITALRERDGTLVGFAKVTRDLTERRMASQRALQDARRVAAAEASSRAKSEFLATLSHELRTPLNAIGGYAELIEMGMAGPLTSQHREYLARIRHSHRHLLGVVEDLLDYSRIESGGVTFTIQSVPIHEVAERALSLVAPQAAANRLSLMHDGCERAMLVRADPVKAEQILLNLLSNAAKFTPVGGEIHVRCATGHGRALISVRDTGPGIPADQVEAIFEPFVQLGRALTRPVEGTGLGLPISRKLASGMGGELTVESAPGGGSTFTLALPLASPQ